jgi:hypothetical protein
MESKGKWKWRTSGRWKLRGNVIGVYLRLMEAERKWKERVPEVDGG